MRLLISRNGCYWNSTGRNGRCAVESAICGASRLSRVKSAGALQGHHPLVAETGKSLDPGGTLSFRISFESADGPRAAKIDWGGEAIRA
jgi:hypothetical protein